MLLPGIIIQDIFLNLLYVVLSLAIVGLGYIIFIEFVRPYFALKAEGETPPPQVDDKYELVVKESERMSVFSVGQMSGDLITKCVAISEDHLIFQFKKAGLGDAFDIIIKRNGPTLFKPPRMDYFLKMDGTERLEGHEIIGKSAFFRISDNIIKDRMTNYIEISLTTNYFIDQRGREKVKFVFTITKVQPSINLKTRNRKGLYSFSRSLTTREKDEAKIAAEAEEANENEEAYAG